MLVNVVAPYFYIEFISFEQAAKEHLTMGNRPSGECAICLYGFSDNDVFSRTPCYHYFHSHCLARYTKYFIESAEDLETEPIVKIYGDLVSTNLYF